MFVLVLFSCVKDKGNYLYKDGSNVKIEFPIAQNTDLVYAFIGETLKIEPKLTFASGSSAVDFVHNWYIDGKLISTDPVLEILPDKKGALFVNYILKDKTNGYSNMGQKLRVVVRSQFDRGFTILYEKNGESEIGHIWIDGSEYIDHLDMYKKLNNDESLGSDPTSIREFEVGGTESGVFVLQNGGQGSVELDGATFKKKLTVKEAFKNSLPANFNPKSVAMLRTADYLLNADGKMYCRFFLDPIPFTMPWFKDPVEYPGGIKIGSMWNGWTKSNSSAIVYDEMHNRLLELQSENSGAKIAEIPDADPWTPYPPDYPPLNNFGSHEYVWGGATMDVTGFKEGLVLLRDPNDHKIYTHSFQLYSGFFSSLQPGNRMLFPANDIITPASKFYTIVNKGFLLFTAGANNDMLYYYDCVTGLPHKLYGQMGSSITAIAGNMDTYNTATIAVGLQNGTTVFYEFSNETILSGQSKELHRVTNLGRVVDIATRGVW